MQTHILIIASDHFTIGHLVTKAICRLVRVHWHIEDIGRVAGC